MAQIVATLLFLLVTGAGVAVIAVSLIDDWALMIRALGFDTAKLTPLPRSRAAVSRQVRAPRIMRLPDERRAVAA